MGLADPELSVVLTDNEHIQALNAQWRDEDKPTDVLSFPLHEADADFTNVDSLGDIVISVEYAESLVTEHGHRDRVAQALGVAPVSLVWGIEEEIDFLLIHGLLHLIGHDHLEPDEEADMRSEERRLWGRGPN
ncbi:MAG: rRNA maturation RNase YbeY [bacterium]